MKKNIIFFSSIAMISIIVFFTVAIKKPTLSIKKIAINQKGFAVLELFTSQGCSSCPMADELLGKYAILHNKQIMVLAFHVDYWNRLGWIDSFSNNKYSQRQNDYAAKLQLQSVYTPQLIVNGQKQFIGSNQQEIANAIDMALNENADATLSIADVAINGNAITFNYTTSINMENILLHAALVQTKVFTNIKAGENRGVKLTNYNVVRDFATTNKTLNGNFFLLHLPNGATAALGFSIILLAQNKNSGKIIGAVQTAL